MLSQNTSFIGDIQVLRGISILMELFAHLGFLLIWKATTFQKINNLFGIWSVVDLFFVVSGFIISKDLFAKLQHIHDSELFWRNVIAFWIKRAWRIAPPAWLWLLVTCSASLIFNQTLIWGTPHGNINDCIAVFLQVKNIHNFSCHQSAISIYGTNGHYWSLSLEDQFYLIFPIFFLFFRKNLVPALFGLIVIQLLFMPIGGQSLYTYIRIIPFVLGVLLAIFYSSASYHSVEPIILKNFKQGRIVFTSLLVICLIVVAGGSIIAHRSLRVNLAFLISMFLVFLASYNQNYLLPEGKIRNFVMFFGMRSYSIYLVHIPVFHFTIELWSRIAPPLNGQFTSDYTFRFIVTASALIALLSEANYRWIEVPARRKGSKIANKFINNRPLRLLDTLELKKPIEAIS